MRKLLLVATLGLIGCGDDSRTTVLTKCTIEKFSSHAELICEDGTEIAVAPVEVIHHEQDIDIEIKNCGRIK